MEEYLDRKGIARVSDIVGRASRDYISAIDLGGFMRDRDGLFGRVTASVDPSACSGCGLCARLCTEGAASMDGGRPAIDASKCRACNLCVLKCPSRAMALAGSEALAELVAEYRASPAGAGFKAFMGKRRLGPFDYLSLPRKLKEWKLA